MYKSNYSLGSRLLHRIALNSNLIARASFEFEQNKINPDLAAAKNGHHVFVCGLARSGTTILMRNLYATGEFRSLTYGDMPFVLMPNTWASFVKPLDKHKLVKKERAHGDGLLVDANSPEALEEVFWRVFYGKDYILKNRLKPMDLGIEALERFRAYVGVIIRSGSSGRGSRYLSKNNNNLLRLRGIAAAFPRARILIPYRDPLQHAYSLLLQHWHFLRLHKADAFSLKYMNWLVHNEFGADHRPFVFTNEKKQFNDPEKLDYWIELWINVYAWLKENAPSRAIFVRYEDICQDSKFHWNALCQQIGVCLENNNSEKLKIVSREVDKPFNAGLLERAKQLYQNLRIDT